MINFSTKCSLALFIELSGRAVCPNMVVGYPIGASERSTESGTAWHNHGRAVILGVHFTDLLVCG